MLTRQIFNVIHVGVGFLVLYSGDAGFAAIQKLINYSIEEDDKNYHVDGYLNLGISYLIFGLSFFFAPPIISLMGCRLTMLFGACGMATSYFIFSFEMTWVAYLGDALSGSCSALTWIAEGRYLVQNSDEHTLSRNVSLFWLFYAATQITGNLITAVRFTGLTVLSRAIRHQTCYISAGLGIAGGIVLSLVREPRGSLIKNTKESSKDALKSVFSMLKSKNVSVLFLTFCYVGFQQSFGWNVYASCVGFTNQFGSIQIVLVPATAVVFGLGGLSAAFLLSMLSTFKLLSKHRHVVYVGFTIQILCFVGVVLNLPNSSIFAPTDDISFVAPNTVLAVICAYGFGIGDSCFNTRIYTILGRAYPEASSQTIALYKLVKSMSVAAFFFLSVAVGLHILVLITVLAGVVGVYAFRWVDLRIEKAETKSTELAS